MNSYLVFKKEKRSVSEGKAEAYFSFLDETDSTFSPDSKGAERLQLEAESVRKTLIYKAAIAAVEAAAYSVRRYVEN